jgi:multidrug transporter EmrE-like cation transporter
MFDSETGVRSATSRLDFEVEVPADQTGAQRRTAAGSIALVVLCTVIGAAAQILMRHGAEHIEGSTLGGLLTNWELLAGYACLAANTALLVLALRRGELSVLYPIIALTYVWVTVLSPMFFGDVINFYKVTGVALIVLGVSFIGLGSRS